MKKRFVCGYQFHLVATIEPERDRSGRVREFNPRTEDEQDLSDAPFCRFSFPADLRQGGVYVIVVADRIVYVGQRTMCPVGLVSVNTVTLSSQSQAVPR
jgi:hypothetical protein